MRIGFIGAGKTGVSLGKYFAVKAIDSVFVQGYYSLHESSAREAAEFTDSKVYDTREELIGECDMIFLTVPDGKLRAVWQDIRESNIRGKLICHCSGAMSSDEVFSGLADAGALGYSIHPLFAVSDKYEAYRELTGVFFTLEASRSNPEVFGGCAGKDPYLHRLAELLEKMGNPARIIAPEDKTLYHCGAAIASNLVCGLADLAVETLIKCGFSEDEAARALSPIMRGNVEHIAARGPVESLTGPVERNDAETVRKHLECITDASDRKLYSLLSRRLVGMAQRRHPDRDYAEMSELLRKEVEK